jgi:hypothetical protein
LGFGKIKKKPETPKSENIVAQISLKEENGIHPDLKKKVCGEICLLVSLF